MGYPVQPYSWVTVPLVGQANMPLPLEAAGTPAWPPRLGGADQPCDRACSARCAACHLVGDALGLALVGDELAVASLLGLLDALGPALEGGEAALGLLELGLAGLDLLAGLDRGAAQLVGAQARRGRHEAQGVEGLLVRGDVLGQLLVLVAVGEVGVGLAHDVGEGVGREDLLEQGRALGAVGLGEALPEGLAAGAQVLLAADELLGQQVQGPVALAQLVDELVVACADTGEALDGLLDAPLDEGLVDIDAVELGLRVLDGGLGAGLVAVEGLDDRVLPGDGAAQLLLALAGGLDLVGHAGARHTRRRAQGHGQQADEA